MSVKEYLMQIEKLDKEIRRRTEQLEELYASLMGKAITYDKPSVQTSPSADILPEALSKMEELTHRINISIRTKAQVKHTIISQIENLESDPKGILGEILYKRYVEYDKHKDLLDIADEMGYAEGYIRHMHGKALQLFQEKYLIK